MSPSSPVELIASVRRDLIAEAGAAANEPGGLNAAVHRRTAGLGAVAALDLLRTVQAELTGAGPLAGLLSDPDVTDVLVNGPRRGVGGSRQWATARTTLVRQRRGGATDRRPLGLRRWPPTGYGRPFVDARLPGGVRLHAVLPPVTLSGACLSLRVHRQRPLDLAALLAGASLAPPLAEVLQAMVAARLSFVISGGAGTGKTTLLGALLALADPEERILVVEDAAELMVSHPHVVRLEARPPNVEGAGEITLRDLVRQALRMRPDRGDHRRGTRPGTRRHAAGRKYRP